MNEQEIITRELEFIARWLDKWCPEDMKFTLSSSAPVEDFTENERAYLHSLAEKIKVAPKDADGAWFHDLIYTHKDTVDLSPKELFTVLYRAIIDRESGPRAGYFLSVLPRDWLVDRLSFRA